MSETGATTPNATGVFEISRAFKAPRDLVWKAYGEADRLQRWWGPKGCDLRVATLEFRRGGFFHYEMAFGDGHAMWGRFIYRDMVAPERIEFITSFANPDCGLIRAPFSDLFPLETMNSVTMTESGGETLVSIASTPHGATAEERAFFNGMFSSMNQGYSGTFDQLEAHLAAA